MDLKPLAGMWLSFVMLFDTYLDCLGVEFKPFLLIGQELLHVLALVTLQLDHLAHFTVMDDGAIAG